MQPMELFYHKRGHGSKIFLSFVTYTGYDNKHYGRVKQY